MDGEIYWILPIAIPNHPFGRASEICLNALEIGIQNGLIGLIKILEKVLIELPTIR